MKEYKEIKFEELSLEQKLGMSFIASCADNGDYDVDYVEELIRNRSLGGVWVPTRSPNSRELIARLKSLADYPLLFLTDAETGWGDYMTGSQNAIGMTDSEELAYEFGKVTAIGAAEYGYNVICSPVLDMVNARAVCGGNVRSLGCDKERVARLAAAEARGMHDGGVLTVGKHYPGTPETELTVDSHMGETFSERGAEDLLSYELYPYLELMKAGLLDGVMLRHARYPAVDPDYPASLSAEHIKLLRERGFDGFAMTDALGMMGVVAKFGRRNSVGLAVGNAGAFALPFHLSTREVMTWLRECYDEGIITDKVLDGVVNDVLRAQHKIAQMQPKFTRVTDEDAAAIEKINKDYIFARCDEGVPLALDRDAEHFFAILTESEVGMNTDRATLDTMGTDWYHPARIADRLQELFPKSKVAFIAEYPKPRRVQQFLSESLGYADVIFITFINSTCYAGKECLTPRIVSTMEAMQVSDRISTLLHFGNPYAAEDAPHIPRVVIGAASRMSVEAGLEVLAGERGAAGVLTYDVNLRLQNRPENCEDV